MSARDRQRVGQRVAQMCVAIPIISSIPAASADSSFPATSVSRSIPTRSKISWKPADPALSVDPDVLDDIRHLETLAKRDSQRRHDALSRVNVESSGAEQIGQHLADYAGDAIAIPIQFRHVG